MSKHPLATKIPMLAPLAQMLWIDQIAFYAPTVQDEHEIKRLWGLDQAEWVEDEVTAIGKIHGLKGTHTNKAKLQFNYDMGIELEILRYLSGPSYVHRLGRERFIHLCHIGMHATGELPSYFSTMAFMSNVLQRVTTVQHTNPFLLETGRRYRYTIYNSTPMLGVCLKVIERMEASHANA